MTRGRNCSPTSHFHSTSLLITVTVGYCIVGSPSSSQSWGWHLYTDHHEMIYLSAHRWSHSGLASVPQGRRIRPNSLIARSVPIRQLLVGTYDLFDEPKNLWTVISAPSTMTYHGQFIVPDQLGNGVGIAIFLPNISSGHEKMSVIFMSPSAHSSY